MAALGWLLNLDFAGGATSAVVEGEIIEFDSEVLQLLAFDSLVRRRFDFESETTQRFAFDSDTH